MVSFAREDICGGFKYRVASFRVAGVALRDIQTCFFTCWKSLCGRRNTFATFSEDALQFSGQAQHFGRAHRHFAWQPRDFRRVVLHVFVRIALSGLRQVATRCKFRGRRGVLWEVMKIDGSLARNIDFEVANLEVHKKTRRKTSVLKLKTGGSLARNARSDAPTCLVSSLWFSCGFAVSMGEAAKLFLVESFQAGCHAVLRGNCGTLWHSNLFDNVSKVVLCCRRNTFVSFSQDELQFAWQVQHSTLYTPRSTLYTSHSTLCTPHSTPYIHSTLYTLHFTLHTPNLTLYTPRSTLYTPHFTRQYTPHFPLYTSHSTLYTPHFTPYTLHSTLYTPHFTLHILHFTPYTLHSTLHTRHFTFYLHFTLHTPYSTLCTPHFTLHTVHSTLYTLHSTLYTLHSSFHTLTLYTLHSTLNTNALYTPHSRLHTPRFTLHTVHATLYALHFTLYAPHSTLHALHFTLDNPHFKLHTLHSRLYTPHSTLSTPPSSIFHSLRCAGMIAGEKCTRLFK